MSDLYVWREDGIVYLCCEELDDRGLVRTKIPIPVEKAKELAELMLELAGQIQVGELLEAA